MTDPLAARIQAVIRQCRVPDRAGEAVAAMLRAGYELFERKNLTYELRSTGGELLKQATTLAPIRAKAKELAAAHPSNVEHMCLVVHRMSVYASADFARWLDPDIARDAPAGEGKVDG